MIQPRRKAFSHSAFAARPAATLDQIWSASLVATPLPLGRVSSRGEAWRPRACARAANRGAPQSSGHRAPSGRRRCSASKRSPRTDGLNRPPAAMQNAACGSVVSRQFIPAGNPPWNPVATERDDGSLVPKKQKTFIWQGSGRCGMERDDLVEAISACF